MNKKICTICGYSFSSDNELQNICSDGCKRIKNRLDKRKCIVCGIYYKYNSNNQKVCSINCKRVNDNMCGEEWIKRNPEKKKTSLKKTYLKNKNNKCFIKKTKCRDAICKDKKKRPEFYPKECCICGSTKNIECHHPDYNFELSIYPLCKKHHVELHSYDKKGGIVNE